MPEDDKGEPTCPECLYYLQKEQRLCSLHARPPKKEKE